MKILYVGDGRSRDNWGAKATSTALHDLLNKNNTISGTIKSELKTRKYKMLIGPASFTRFQNAVIKRKDKALFSALYSGLKAFGLKDDYLTDDVDASVKNFLRIKKYYPALNQAYQDIKNSDAVVLNGEGTFIFTTPPRHDAIFFLVILKLAQSLGKKTYCLNSMISDCPVNGRNMQTVTQMIEIFKKCDGITLRDPYSYKFLKEIAPGLSTKFVPDALFTWISRLEKESHLPAVSDKVLQVPANGAFTAQGGDFSKPYICISGSSLAAWTKDNSIPAYVDLVNKLKEAKVQLYIVPTASGDSFLHDVAQKTNVPLIPEKVNILAGAAILANAEVFVSGRFHPSILASLGGTPCVFMGSNSHKTLTLQDMLEYDSPIEYNAIPSAEDIERIYSDVVQILGNVKERKEKIKNTVRNLAKTAEKELEVLVT